MVLRPIQIDDAQAIFDGYGQDPDVTRYLTWRPHRSIEETREFIGMCSETQAARAYAIVLRGDDTVIGVFDLRRTGQAKLEFGYVLARRFWGRGLMTEALAEVSEWALRQPTVWRIGAAVDVENVSSIRVMEKAGFRREGVLRRWLVHPGIGDAPRDCFIFSLTR